MTSCLKTSLRQSKQRRERQEQSTSKVSSLTRPRYARPVASRSASTVYHHRSQRPSPVHLRNTALASKLCRQRLEQGRQHLAGTTPAKVQRARVGA
eukprot:6183922-Pleurochrysis_carterae.AAC.2